MIRELLEEDFDNLKHLLLTKEYYLNEIKNNPYAKFLVMEENQEMIAFLYYSDIYDRAEINQIEVSSFHRNCGKGDRLLKEMISIVKKDITLEVKETNTAAIHLYENNGFIRKAIRKGYYQGIDGILMERKEKETF